MRLEAARALEAFEECSEESSLIESINGGTGEMDLEEESALEFIKQWQPSPKKQRA